MADDTEGLNSKMEASSYQAKEALKNEGEELRHKKTSVSTADDDDDTVVEESKKARTKGKGISFRRYYTAEGVDPYDMVEWEVRTASISNESGKSVFEQKDAEIPKSWSMLATNVVVSKYFRGKIGTPERENSVRHLIGRVADTIFTWGKADGYFKSADDARSFHHELTFLLLNQYAAFNSPVWFNVGIDAKPQCSACFINSVDDNMASILSLAKTEGMLFKHGSGTGSNLSKIRSSKESLSGGGTSSGPVSFMKGFDAFAGVIKSGGKTRRAAKMVILNADHPDIEEFITSKAREEKKAWALIDAGYDGSFNGEAYNSIFFQNANHSVRVTDEFMKAVVEDREWVTREVLSGKISQAYKARNLMQMISESAHLCGDPGMQYDTTINEWHTCKNTDRINASNPCSEYMFLDDTACNLASLNLMKFLDDNLEFDVEGFRHACDVLIAAQEILVSRASYPTPKIGTNSEDYRPLGLGYANLGALLMSWGLPYDSDTGRAVAGAITALMCGQAYLTSAHIAREKGPFNGYAKNREPMLDVIRKHRDHVAQIDKGLVHPSIMEAAQAVWDDALVEGEKFGFRNSQVTVLAPTGTIGFMMDCDTTGVEPDIALIKYKKLVGGGLLKIVNQSVPKALKTLGYTPDQIQVIIQYIEEKETIEGAPALREEDLAVFDCAFKPLNGNRTIHYMGHLRMMAATQPFLSGAISKTVNVPEDATVEDMTKAYMEGWRLGLKALAIYRDGSKRIQPLNTGASKSDAAQPSRVTSSTTMQMERRKLPDERQALTHKFSVAGHEGYITVGLFEDGTPGEIFIVMAKEGSTISGLMDSFATAISLALQYGVPLKVLIEKFAHTRFEPSGFTKNKKIPMAKSVMDYIFRWLATHFMDHPAQQALGIQVEETLTAGNVVKLATGPKVEKSDQHMAPIRDSDAPSCYNCGSIMVRNGACYKCWNCGCTSGCS